MQYSGGAMQLLGSLRRSGLRSGVLEHFYRNPATRIHVRGLATTLGVDSTNLSRELRRLEEEGFLKSEVEGRNLCYSIDLEYPELKTVVELMQKLFDGGDGMRK